MNGPPPRRRSFTVLDRWHDLADDVLVEATARRGRALLMAAGVALSTGALVASSGISRTASQQITADMAASTLDEVVVSAVTGSGESTDVTGAAAGTIRTFPDDAEDRATAIDLVRSAGLMLDLSLTSALEVTRLDPALTAADDSVGLRAATSGYLEAAQAVGAESTAWMLDGTTPVAVVGIDAAAALGLPTSGDPTGLTVQVDGSAVPVIGFVEGTSQIRSSVLLPYAWGRETVGSDTQATMLVRTEAGAGSPVARVVRTAILPGNPSALATSQVATFASLRQGVSTQLGRMVGLTGAFLLILTVLLITNSMIVSVVARTSEIGLRRALGYSRAGVSATFWAEGAVIGFLGGCAGAALATGTVVAVAAASAWTPALNPVHTALSPLLGALVGLIASVLPALRAGRISPAVAVRAD